MKAMSEMTNTELIQAIKNYDKMQNEGGNGYNPYRDEYDRRAREQWEQDEANRSPREVLGDRLYKARKDLETKCGSIAREFATNEEIDKLENELRQEIKDIEKEIDELDLSSIVEAGWTLEETQKRRENWNNWARSQGATITFSSVSKKQKELGWTTDELKKAIRLHGLKKNQPSEES